MCIVQLTAEPERMPMLSTVKRQKTKIVVSFLAQRGIGFTTVSNTHHSCAVSDSSSATPPRNDRFIVGFDDSSAFVTAVLCRWRQPPFTVGHCLHVEQNQHHIAVLH
ncbi:MAG: hypothetical protein N2Z75_10195, partial [Meiothermus sp.]|nr:hypothetical protein [Meiothermus sp.]